MEFEYNFYFAAVWCSAGIFLGIFGCKNTFCRRMFHVKVKLAAKNVFLKKYNRRLKKLSYKKAQLEQCSALKNSAWRIISIKESLTWVLIIHRKVQDDKRSAGRNSKFKKRSAGRKLMKLLKIFILNCKSLPTLSTKKQIYHLKIP